MLGIHRKSAAMSGSQESAVSLIEEDVCKLLQQAYAAVCSGDEKRAEAKVEAMVAMVHARRLTDKYHVDTVAR